jgi:acetyl-CoA carboxylase biotin carboxyl carrier protein
MESFMDQNKQYPYQVETGLDDDTSSVQQVSVGQLRRLVRLLDESDVSEVEVKLAHEQMHLVLRKAKVQVGSEAGDYSLLMAAGSEHAEVSSEVGVTDAKHTIVAPLVGIFHSWGKPKGGPAIAVGDHVKVAQLVGTIQSLNVINEVECTIAGRVVEILVQDGQPVEYGQPLVSIDSSEEA